MTIWCLIDAGTGELRRTLMDHPEGQGLDLDGLEVVELPAPPDPHATIWDPSARAFVPRVPALRAREIYNLFTAQEKAAIHGSVYAPVQGLISALLFAEGPIAMNSPFHINGVGLLAQLGLLTPERAAQVLAFEPPPTSSGIPPGD
jgi:hypothetical protein